MAESVRITFYHNPRCSKSRQALALLEQRGVDVDVVRYLEQPPSASELRKLLQWLGLEPAALLRRGESEYRERDLGAHLDDATMLLQAMVEAPILIERPIAIRGERAVVGRPPERVLELLD